MSIEISVVVPLYNEEETLGELYRRLDAVLRAMGDSYEMVLVDDGSRDATPRLIDDLAKKDPRVIPIHLSRNFGHQPAISAGIDRARGRGVIVMDGDLQDPPEVLPQFVQLWRTGVDVVYAVRRNRKENAVKRLGYFAFYRLLRAVGDIDIPLDSGDFCLMDRRVVEALKGFPERCRFVRGLRTSAGFRQVGLEYDRAGRELGRPKYSMPALVRLAVDGLVSFSGTPLRTVTRFGLLTLVTTAGLAVWALVDHFTRQSAPPGWASLILVVLFLGSVQLLSLGIIGEYIRLIFLEVKGRPPYIIDDRPARRDEMEGEERR